MVFYTEEKKIRPELFDTEAKKWAEGMKYVSKNQMRRIYDEVKRLGRKIETKEDWAAILPFVKMEKSKITYTVKRAKEKASGRDKDEEMKSYERLKSFIFEGIDAVHEQEDYQLFCQFFEAVYGYYYEVALRK